MLQLEYLKLSLILKMFEMASSELFDKINYKKAYRANRLGAANWVLDNPETFEELLGYCFGNDKELATKATWALEFIARDKLEMLYPFLDLFFENLPKATGDGVLRSVGLICELLCIEHYKKKSDVLGDVFTKQHKLIMTDCAFDWMITGQKVACQARAMTALYFLGTEQDWIHPELAQIIEQNIHQGSPGYKARGKATLELIRKFRI